MLLCCYVDVLARGCVGSTKQWYEQEEGLFILMGSAVCSTASQRVCVDPYLLCTSHSIIHQQALRHSAAAALYDAC
jgi:hypothetical protein